MSTRFEQVQRLAPGSEGGTWTGLDPATNRRVVLKRVSREHVGQWRRAFSVLQRVSSPHLPALLEALPDDDGGVWSVTAWVEGVPVAPGPAPVSTVLAEGKAVAHALATIHEAGTHHGDVSADNVIVTPTGGVVLTDLARLGRRGMGTPGFLAPEVLGGGGGPAADVFALGSLLCWRLFGEVPWRKPAELMQVRTAGHVRARMHALQARRTDPAPALVVALVADMLHPDPTHRPHPARDVVQRLSHLHAALEVGREQYGVGPFWIPRRWPYRGPDLTALVDRVTGRQPPTLIAVAGPEGTGRGRMVEELILLIQARALGPSASPMSARLLDPEHVDAVLGYPETGWLEAWMQARSGPLLGLREPPSWPKAHDDERRRAAVLRMAARWARVPLVLPVTAATGAGLQGAEGIEVVHVEPWDERTIGQVIDAVLGQGYDRDRWVDVVRRTSGGWPAKVVRSLTVAARTGFEQPEADELLPLLEQAPAGERLDRATAEAVLSASWGLPPARPLPEHMHDGEVPLGWAEAAARTTLGRQGVCDLARARLHDCRDGQRPAPLGLLLDADDAEAIGTTLRAGRWGRAWPRLRAWMDGGGATRLAPEDQWLVAAAALRRGRADRVLAWLPSRPEAPHGRLLVARALQRSGRSEEALALLEDRDWPDLDSSEHARGLRWRALIDLGRASEVVSEARREPPSRSHHGAGAATAWLWAGYAAVACGRIPFAIEWLELAEACLEGCDDPEVLARVLQVRGNVAHVQGQLANAQQLYRRAARAFERAREHPGLLGVSAALANLCVATAEVAEGLEFGRAAVKGLAARGEVQRLPEAASALVQLLVRTGRIQEAQAVTEGVQAMLEQGPALGALAVGRMRRLEGELAIGLRVQAELPRAASISSTASELLLQGGARREAIDARLRAATCSRMAGELSQASQHLGRVEQWAHDQEDAQDDGRVRSSLVLEQLAQAVAQGELSQIEQCLRALVDLPSASALQQSGHLELAWQRQLGLLSALRIRLPRGHRGRVLMCRRVLETLEVMMTKASSEDRKSVRAALLTEGGDATALRELLEELEEEPSEPAAVPDRSAARRAHDGVEPMRLLRMYRRLAREDDLPRLLEQVVDAIMELTDAERGAVVVHGLEHSDEPLLEVTRELAAGSDGFRFSRSVITRVLESGQPVLSVDAAEDERFDGSRSISHLNLRSVLAVPLTFRGELLGAAYVDHRIRRGNFDEDDLSQMEQFAELAALAVAHARALAAVRSQSEALARQGQELARLLEEREAEVHGLREVVRSAESGRNGDHGMIGSTPEMQRIFRLIDRLADSEVPVVVRGESGTGKELVARAIHDAGSRRGGPFVAENCGAIPETLLEGVLFGHAKGAFTGAQRAKPGLFEAADGGTIFLDEISEMSPAMQTKLLRVLQEGEIRRVGENGERSVNVRVIAASNRDLEAMVEAGQFRQDLYYRIKVVQLELPPLRARRDDLPALVRHFLDKHGGAALTLSGPAMRLLRRHDWPGNVRELENEVQRWVALADGRITPDDLSPAVRGDADADGIDPDDLRLRRHVERLERELIERALERSDGNQTRAAELLGLSRYGLQKKLKRLEVAPSA